MSETMQATVTVSKTSVVITDEQTVFVVLKGQKTIVHNNDGYELEDIVDVELKLKCNMKSTLKLLGVGNFTNTKILDLRDRDTLLSDFGGEPQKVVE
jgi:hypothetical protein